MGNRFFCRTSRGTFWIVFKPNRGWVIWFDSDELDGPFRTAQHAVDVLVGGHTPWPSGGFDPSRLGMPSDIGDWERG